MKTILIVGMISGVIIGGMTLIPNVQESLKETIEIEKTVEVNVLENRIKEAQDAAQASTTAKAQAAYDEVIEGELERIETEVKIEYIKEIEGTFASDWREERKAVKRPVLGKTVIERIIINAFPEDPHTAVAIAKCESGLNPNAYNPTNTNGTTDGGLFQINSAHDSRLNKLGLDKFNPVDATKYARILYDEQGWHPWTCAKKIAMR